ncbi:Tetratricopeptide-like helical domain superfamily [Sesbania bispinosa]|nr:Tetratricopeptide-like helical domain superfamily [Sesbania bispinosa]
MLAKQFSLPKHTFQHCNVHTLKDTILAQIKGCSREQKLESVYASMIKTNANQDCFLMNQFITACSITSRIDLATSAFSHMQNPNVLVYNASIRACVHCHYYSDQALAYYMQMLRNDVVPTSYSFSSLFKACTLLMDSVSGKVIHGHVWKRGFDSHVFVQTTLVEFYSTLGHVADSRKAFDDMPERDVIAWTTMISAHVRNDDIDSAVKLFDEMPEKNTATWNAIIDGYAKSGNVECVEFLFNKMPCRDVISWTTVMTCYSRNKRYANVIALFHEMVNKGMVPDEVAMTTVISACAHLGALGLGKEEYCISPQVEHYGCMVDLLSKGGLIEDALEMIRGMAFEPNSYIWGALLNGCKLHRNLEIAHIAVQSLMVLEPCNSGYYSLLVNMYAEVNRWNEVAKIRTAMKDLGVEKRCPGSSWIEINKKIHLFAASDKHHPSYGQVHLLLVELDDQLRLAGSVLEMGSFL